MTAGNDFRHVTYLWDDETAAGLDPVGRLVYRSNLLGQDQRITNTGGGNTSSKYSETDPLTGEAVEVLWVKGSGGDLRTSKRENFSSLYMEKVRQLRAIYDAAEEKGVKTPIEDEMVGKYLHCVYDLNPRASSIDTPLHAFIPAPIVDHTHPNAVIAIAAAEDGEALTAEIFGDELGWVGWQRPGFDLGLAMGEMAAANADDAFEQGDGLGPVGQPQHVAHRVGLDHLTALGLDQGLIQQRQAVTHRPLGRARDQGQGVGLDLHAFAVGDPAQVFDQDLRLDPTQVEPLAPAQDRHRNLADLGGGEDEFGVGRRLLQRLQQGVERLRRQHMHLVQHIDLVARLDRRVADAFQDVADVVDAGVRRRVHLHHVHVLAGHDGRVVPPVGGQGQRRLVDAVGFVVQGAGQQTRGRGLADPRTPVSMKAWAIRPVAKALVRVLTIASCPIRSSKVRGRYLRAST